MLCCRGCQVFLAVSCAQSAVEPSFSLITLCSPVQDCLQYSCPGGLKALHMKSAAFLQWYEAACLTSQIAVHV